MTPRTIAIANQKGGVGKTTTAVNLSAAFAARGIKTLLIDLDPQGNATVSLGLPKSGLAVSSWHWLTLANSFADVVKSTQSGVDMIPSNGDLTAVEVDLLRADDRNRRLTRLLAAGETSVYDYTIIDCPPSLNVLTLNALMCSTGILIPMQCEYFALEGLSSLVRTIEAVRARGNEVLKIEGIVRTMYDPRNGLTNAVTRQLVDHFGEKVYRTVIPRNVRLAEAPSHGKPVNEYNAKSKGAIAYNALANEMLRRHQYTIKDPCRGNT